MKLYRVFAVLLLVVTAVAGQLIYSNPAVAATDPCTMNTLLVNSCRPLLGAYTTGYPDISGGALGQVEAAESRIGRQYDIVHTGYHTGPSQLTSEEITLANRANTNIFLDWKPDTGANAWLNSDGVANGGQASIDAGIVQMANSIKSVPSKVLLTLWAEPENDVTPGTVSSTTPSPGTSTPACPGGVNLVGDAGSPAQYIAMWQNVRNIFAQQGVTNVLWVMTDETYAPFTCLTTLLYPGNSAVDWMAFDTYDRGLTGAEGTSTAPFEGTAGAWYNHLEQVNNATTNFVSKPWAVGEFGSCIDSSSQAQVDSYYADAKYSVDNNLYPNIKLYTDFDAPGSGVAAPGGCQVGYTPNGVLDPTTQADYNRFADDPLFTDAAYETDETPPTVPANLTATPVSGTQINLSWNASTDNVGVAGYAVYRNGTQIATVTSGTTYADTGLTNGTSYQYTVDAYDAAGNVSAQSPPVTAMTVDTVAPSVPAGLLATAAGASQVNLSWNASTDNVGVAGYQVFRNGTPVADVTNGTSYSDTGLAEGATYQYTVDAYDAAGNVSGQSATAGVTISDTTPPTVPTNLTATAVSGTQINLSWTASTDNVGVAGYTVFRNGTQIATVTNGTSYADTGLAVGASYQYTVAAYDAAGNVSAQSAAATATTLSDTTPPTVPTGLAAIPVSGTQVNLSWNASTDNVGVTGYQVFRNGTLVATVSTGTTYSDTGLTNATSYQYTVDAYDAAGNISAQSTATSVATPDTTPPSVPTGVAATAVSGTQVNVSWNASTDNVGVTGYAVFRNGTQIATVTSGTSYADTGLTNATSYQYSVAAYDAAANISAQSPVVSVSTPDTTPPTVPTGLTAVATSGTQVNVSWNASTDNVGVTGYIVYRNGNVLATVTSGTTYSDTGLTNQTSYTYTVAAYDAAGNISAQSPPVNVSTPDTIPPTVPTGLAATAVSGTQVNLSWNASTDNVGVVGYQVFRNGTLVASVSTGTTYSDTGLTNATTYKYSVAAYDAAGNLSAQSAAVSAVTPDTAAPTVPTNLVASSTSSNQVNLSWTASTDNVGVKGYQVFRGGTLLAVVTSGTSYQDKSVSADVAYLYTVDAYDAAGNTSVQSTSASVTPPDTTPPTTPTSFSSSILATSVKLSWKASTDNIGVTGYVIYRNGTKLTTTKNLTYSDGTVVQGVTYKYTVAATDAAGNLSAQTAVLSVLFPDTTPPSAPTKLTATPGTKSVALSWTASTDNVGVKGYDVYRGSTLIATVTGTSYTDTGLTSGASYSFHIVAFDAAGNLSPSSSTVTAKAK
ncbi:MAG TPA: fibronectin type III domain-containing protein [Candidatus Saccharimonadia bacterium]|nr:fibronectin type III domain-containing protein [Candidatus Saccharimonadia bacterium]